MLCDCMVTVFIMDILQMGRLYNRWTINTGEKLILYFEKLFIWQARRD